MNRRPTGIKPLLIPLITLALAIGLLLPVLSDNAAASPFASCDFEDGTTQAWTKTAGTTVAASTAQAHSGSYSLLINQATAQESITESSTYYVSFWIYVSGTNAGTIWKTLHDSYNRGAYILISATRVLQWFDSSAHTLTTFTDGWHRIQIWQTGVVFDIQWDSEAKVTGLTGKNETPSHTGGITRAQLVANSGCVFYYDDINFYDTEPPAVVAPTADFSADPLTGTAGETEIQFTDSSTNGGETLTYAWDFDNDADVDSTAQNPTYTYPAAGTYTVKLTVTNSAGSDDEIKTDYITIESAFVPWAPTFTNSPEESVLVGESYFYEPTTNETATITVDEKPEWLTWADGALTGTVPDASQWNVSIKAESIAGTLFAWLNWTITADWSPPVFTNSPEANGSEGVWYEWLPTTNEACTFEITVNPGFLFLSPFDGFIYGVPDAGGDYTVEITATNAHNKTTALSWTLSVMDVLPIPEDDETGTDTGTDTVNVSLLSEWQFLIVIGFLALLLIAAIVARRRH